MSAAAASRDVTLSHAMQVLHNNGYDIGKAVLNLVPPGGPTLCRDEMEEWSASEASLFEDAVEKYGKDFSEIRQDFVSSRTSGSWPLLLFLSSCTLSSPSRSLLLPFPLSLFPLSFFLSQSLSSPPLLERELANQKGFCALLF